MDFIDQAKAILESSKKQPDDMCQNVDTIYSDIMKKSNYKIEGISDSILESYIAAENKADFESLFYLLTGVTFEYYLHICEGTIQRNVAETELRIIQIYLFKSNKSRKNSLIIQTDAPKIRFGLALEMVILYLYSRWIVVLKILSIIFKRWDI